MQNILNNAHKFYNSFSLMIGFMVFIVFFNMMFGEKPTQYLLSLVLLGMVLTNIEDIKSLIAIPTTNNTNNKTNNNNSAGTTAGKVAGQILK